MHHGACAISAGPVVHIACRRMPANLCVCSFERASGRLLTLYATSGVDSGENHIFAGMMRLNMHLEHLHFFKGKML